jgi:protein required for attachment to host cells
MIRWLLVCDVSYGRIFRKDSSGSPMQLVQEISNPDGRAQESGAAGPNAPVASMEPKNTAHQEMMMRFARHLADLLDKAALRNEYDELAIVAPARLLGQLREQLSNNVSTRLRSDLAKEIAHVPMSELPSHLKDLGPNFVGM